jgi:hypothetical protein
MLTDYFRKTPSLSLRLRKPRIGRRPRHQGSIKQLSRVHQVTIKHQRLILNE